MSLGGMFGGVSLLGTIGQLVTGNQIADKQSQIGAVTGQRAELSRQQAEADNLRSARAQVRQARLTRAAMIQSSIAGNTQTSTGTTGSQAGLTTAYGSEFGIFASTMRRQAKDYGFQQQIGQLTQDIGSLQKRSALFSAIGGVSGTIFSQGFDGYKGLFSDNTGT